VKNDKTALIAPESVLADGGTIIGGGSGPVNGIRIEGFVIEDALLAEGSYADRSDCK
jgi:hypothetical protein